MEKACALRKPGARIAGMKKTFVFLSAALVIAIGIAACGTSRAGYETAPCQVIRTDGAFEIREYPQLKIATTAREGDDSSFMRLFRYIDGGNAEKQKIAMTTPVFMVEGRMAFVMPAAHSTTTPAPSSPAVAIDTLKAQRVAVHRFSGSRSTARETQALEQLKAWLQQNQLTGTGPAFSAYYDPPWTPGPLRRNEVLIPVQP